MKWYLILIGMVMMIFMVGCMETTKVAPNNNTTTPTIATPEMVTTASNTVVYSTAGETATLNNTNITANITALNSTNISSNLSLYNLTVNLSMMNRTAVIVNSSGIYNLTNKSKGINESKR